MFSRRIYTCIKCRKLRAAAEIAQIETNLRIIMAPKNRIALHYLIYWCFRIKPRNNDGLAAMFSQLFMLHAPHIHIRFVSKQRGNDNAYLARGIQHDLRFALRKTKRKVAS